MVSNINLHPYIKGAIDTFFQDIPPEAFEEGKARLAMCDLSVAPEAPGDLECRLARALAVNARPSGGMG